MNYWDKILDGFDSYQKEAPDFLILTIKCY